jgi:hypothetical protein
MSAAARERDPDTAALLLLCIDDRLEIEADRTAIVMLEAARNALVAELGAALAVAVDQPQ